MLVPRLTLTEDTISFSAQSHCPTPCTDVGESLGDKPTHAIELPWEEGRNAFAACIVIPRVVALDVMARRHDAAPWQPLLQLQVCPGPFEFASSIHLSTGFKILVQQHKNNSMMPERNKPRL